MVPDRNLKIDPLDERSAVPQTPVMDFTKASAGNKIFLALFIVGLVAAGVGALVTYRNTGAESDALAEHGVRADADVVSVSEVVGAEEVSRLRVSYDPPGERFLDFAEVTDCSRARYEQGVGTVRVVYLPDDPNVIRLEACEDSFDDNILPGIIGVALLLVAALAMWRLRRLWRAEADTT